MKLKNRGVHSKKAFGSNEGAGGSLTVYDTEESPLSIVQVVRRSEKTEMFRLMLQKRYDTGCVQ